MVFGLGKPNIKRMEEEADVEGLIKALNYKENAQIRADAARALGVISEERVLKPLIPTSKDGRDTRDVGFVSDERAVEPVIHLPKDGNKDVLRAVIQAFLVIVLLILLLRLVYLLWIN